MTQHETNAPIVSHGRGGQGNIGPDSNEYVDGGIVREGPVGDQGDGAYSAGRGGAGNIGSPHVKPAKQPHDVEFIPEISVRQSMDGDYHTGRGGQGNVHLDPQHQKAKEEKKEEKKASLAHEGLADKLKHKILGKK
ncbi:DUF3602 domain-containing protein [Aspergillus nidulans FGSC A4]|uniref:Uncharacterized protein n=1 Tax=Emericella nidulans (strain FGSC A4 / ATCC 38163 / CBS 112.46 / NRRL 194 / M139) TaxID=227321 RepID=C8VIZ6_EMENI|nr:hypothetical protein [Aspergillus nidulans FGSC A4]CBF83630.1 TPA: conserved hypothetical protein [Aspergillus nidulans FGSC A4]